MMTLGHTVLHKIKLHAMEAWPEECCGVLLGSENGATRRVCDVVPLTNAREENRGRRFLVTPEEYRSAERRAKEEGVAVLGFYHSHPDHPAQPSAFDLEHAMPWFSYVIASVERGLPTNVRSWVLLDDRSAVRLSAILE